MATARIPQPTAEDPVKVDPRHYTIEFENERVRVLRIKYGAGEKSVMHSHPESIAVFLTDSHAKFTYRKRADGGHQGERRDGAAHGRVHPSAGEPEQRAIRGHPSRVEALGSGTTMIDMRAGFLPLSFSGAECQPSLDLRNNDKGRCRMKVILILAIVLSLTLISVGQEKADKAVTVETLKQFLAAFNAHDLDAVMSFFADDCELMMPREP